MLRKLMRWIIGEAPPSEEAIQRVIADAIKTEREAWDAELEADHEADEKDPKAAAAVAQRATAMIRCGQAVFVGQITLNIYANAEGWKTDEWGHQACQVMASVVTPLFVEAHQVLSDSGLMNHEVVPVFNACGVGVIHHPTGNIEFKVDWAQALAAAAIGLGIDVNQVGASFSKFAQDLQTDDPTAEHGQWGYNDLFT